MDCRGHGVILYMLGGLARSWAWEGVEEEKTDIVIEHGDEQNLVPTWVSNTQKLIVQGDTCTDKGRNFVGKDCPRGEQEDKWIQRDCSAMWLAVSGFYGDGISFRVVSGQSF